MILDITHMADQAVWESFEPLDGPVMASHCTCRALVPGQRHLHDDMIRELVRRGGIIGLVFCQSFIDPRDRVGEPAPMHESGWKPRYAMDGLLPHVERIADLAGGTIANIAIGTDMDGGFGGGAHADRRRHDRRHRRLRGSPAHGGDTDRRTPMRSCTATPCASSRESWAD